jgi:hypothetical protein
MSFVLSLPVASGNAAEMQDLEIWFNDLPH